MSPERFDPENIQEPKIDILEIDKPDGSKLKIEKHTDAKGKEMVLISGFSGTGEKLKSELDKAGYRELSLTEMLKTHGYTNEQIEKVKEKMAKGEWSFNLDDLDSNQESHSE
jgi:hypothetical protein